MALAVEVQIRTNSFVVFPYQECMPFIQSLPYSSGLDHPTAKHVIINCCNYLIAKSSLRDNPVDLRNYRKLVTILAGLKKVTKRVIERRMLG
jgi:hypothetical protein